MARAALALAALGAAACGDTARVDGLDGAGPQGGLAVIAVHVVDPVDHLAPVAGMPVAFELAGGGRIEVLTDAAGTATAQLDLGALRAVITHRDGWSFAAAAPSAVRRDALGNGSLRLFSAPLPARNLAPSGVVLSGQILNRVDPESAVRVSHTAGGGTFIADGAAAYESVVAPARPFTLVALEWLSGDRTGRTLDDLLCGWFVAEQAPVSAAATLDVDFSRSVEPTLVSGSIAAPPDAALAARGRLDVRVHAGDAQVGAPTSTLPLVGDAGYAFTVEHVVVPGQPLRTWFGVETPEGARSGSWRAGAPTTGLNDVRFVAPPERLAPLGSGPHPWATPVEWSPDADRTTAVELTFRVQGQPVGVALVAADDTTFTLPALPSTSTTLSDSRLEVSLEVCVDPDQDARCDQWARGAPFTITSPFAE